MSSKFCPKCGKKETKNNPLVPEICQECFSKNDPLLKNYKEQKIIICPSCDSFMDKNKWLPKLSNNKELNVKEIIKQILPEKLKFSSSVKITSTTIGFDDSRFKKSGVIQVFVALKGKINDIESKDEYTLPVRIEKSLCNDCKKSNSSYYEAIIQVRPKDDVLLDFIETDIKENSRISVSKFEESKHGYDLYITSKSYLKNILPKVKSKFNIESKISKTLFGKKEGKDVYRITLLIRLKE